MRIGALAQTCGVDADTVRYYEKQGLLPPPQRQSNGYRAFDARHVERLAFIRHCRTLDMSLAEIKRLLDAGTHPEADCGDINTLIDNHLTKLRHRIVSMQVLEQQLMALRSRCGEQRAVEACGILNELVAVSRGGVER
ncbi:Cd(II)/Pb(II)-responsive transcriptional regulator [Denitromonas halophila]|uniref:Cd(II)/Pb(II)-responsive transcriptional regulator n=1 Tax=Denitromonas halophila TaxID=1629404 RepID=A0A557QQR1_9RHOO|nr:Cd(II)/Pb(II)-responsive transcriptional regulator [Denitromonas halophila]TVO55250.1 Cd(II)/Pb(II)-responsive transcriptional regulator [Denitromonas halophila]